MISTKLLIISLSLTSNLIGALPSNGRLNVDSQAVTIQVISRNGYPAEAYQVMTEDGYILEMHRIPHGLEKGTQPGPPVFLMHGLTASSHGYVSLGPENALAYNLADAGFDVWMGNARGTTFSKEHTHLNPNDRDERREFFDFSWEEIALYDLPAMIDYILEHTCREHLHYIGHSQGGTVFLVLNSVRTEYQEKIKSAHLLAGVGYKGYFPDPLLTALSMNTEVIYSLAQNVGFVEIGLPTLPSFPNITLPDWFPFPTDEMLQSYDCTGELHLKDLCDLTGAREVINIYLRNSAPEFLQGFGGASLKQFAHYGQNIDKKQFRRWDHGVMKNTQIYGQPEPPRFDLSLIKVNTVMHYTVNDGLLDKRDVLDMARDMPNTVARKVARETFTHVDFIAAPDVKELVHEYIIEALSQIEFESEADDALDEEVLDSGNDEIVPNNNSSSISIVPAMILNVLSLIYVKCLQ